MDTPSHTHCYELPAPAEWMSWTDSEKAWMSIRDADLLELLVLTHARDLGRPIDVLEWGSGRSTLWFSGLLQARGLLHSWLTLEHNRTFFLQELAPKFEPRPDRSYTLIDGAPGRDGAIVAPDTAVAAVVFDGGDLRPYDEETHRTADLDTYVQFPAMLERRFDLVVIDGRKRRRCLIEASQLLSSQGVTVLHDAWRSYYECAFGAFAAGTHIGDELWVGAQHEPDLRAILPAHAFEDWAGG